MNSSPYVTEAYLQKQVEQHAALEVGRVMLDLAFGSGYDNAEVTGAYADKDYIKNRTVNVYVKMTLRNSKGAFNYTRPLFTVAFGRPLYDTDESGVFNKGKPHILDDGRVSTGEYTTVDNQTSEPIEHEIEKTVEEAESSSVSLTESLELKSGTTIEAGTDAAKVSQTLEATFGIAKTATEDHSTTQGEAIKDTEEVDPEEQVVISYNEARAVVDQPVNIAAPLDWQKITITTHELVAASGPNSHYLYGDANRHLWDGSDGSARWFHVDGWVAFGSLVRGFDLRAPGLRKWYQGHLSSDARAALDLMEGTALRRLSFNGNRRSNNNKSASYAAYIVNGWDGDRIEDAFGQDGTPVDELDKLAKRK